ncbi:EAL domain-containing protein [Methylomonas sp. LL1]|uniref:bifunctional diguanylate cyclase/phosphodiesterase n=1 Tax=Methylomonas sp. LL1 TaxID=2785785 RepID=UPI0018C3DF5D|nr:EAL domain-containing protein [Methylomonas sp. LL1]QPK63764.1 EAL domain-containing protein [Methylomonas sp. LL1]
MKLTVGIKLGFWLALFGSLSIGLFGYYIHGRSQELLIQSSRDKLLTATQVLAHRFTDALTEIAADVKFIETLPLTLQSIEPSANPKTEQQLAAVFSSLLASRPEYSQIRLIDGLNHGKERVRVDRDLIGIKIVTGNQLQEKNHFPYVFEAMRLPAGQLYVSEINLNQELGAHLGFGKPTVRIATPIASQDHKQLGIIVINVNLDDLFNRIRADLPENIKVLLTNSHGDYLIHPDPTKTFAFERGRQFLIQDDIQASRALLNGEKEHAVITTGAEAISGGAALAAFMRVPFGSADARRMVMLGLYTPLEKVLAESETLGVNVIQVTALFSVLAVLMSVILARILAKPLNLMTKTVAQFEPGKPLSDLPSHRNDEIGYLATSFSTMITKLNQQVAALHASETKLQTILDNLPLGIWLVGSDGESRFLNKTFQTALGISDRDFFTDPRLAHLLQLDDNHSVASDAQPRQEIVSFSDGRQHLLEVNQVRLKDHTGTSHAAIGIAIDITERRQAEQILRSSEEKLRTMFAMSPLGIAQNATDGRYIEANKALLDMVGYSLQELNQMSYWELTPQEYEQQEMFQLQSLSETGKYGPYEKEYLHRDGHRIPIRLNGVLISDSDGQQYIWSIVEDITQKKQSEQLIWQQANFDPLTRLPNRRMFHDRLTLLMKKAHRTGLPLALILLDLDHFKEVNDTLGHDMGDLLLTDAAHRLLGCVRESDTVARLGGDEFTLILDELEDLSGVERIIQTILQKLAEPFQLKDKQAYVSASIGITYYPRDSDNIDTLIKNADQAMYAAKHQGRNRYSFFTASMQEAAMVKMQTAGDLRHALADDQFKLYYQPIVNLRTGEIRKAEALLRWLHPTNSALFNPNNFISIAEDIGIIGEIGDWVFKEATRQAAEWRAQYSPQFQISVNKSPLQFFKNINQHQLWLDHLQSLGLPGDSVVIEITEGLLLDANQEVTEILSAFRKAGIKVSLDDFGTGYSSLAYLKKFDIDYIKIDRSFVSHLSPHSNDMALCEAIIVMAHKLGMKVIAEGIETSRQRDLLLEADCDFGQGFLFAKPLPAEEFERLLRPRPAA